MNRLFHIIICSSFLFVMEAAANIPAHINVDPGSAANLTVAIIIGTPPDTETSVDSFVVGVAGGGDIEFSPDQEPFTSVGLNQLQFILGNANFDYEIFCGDLFGCVDVYVSLTDLQATLVYQTGASFTETGRAEFSSTWRLQGNYNLTSALFDSNGPIDITSDLGFGATFNVGGGNVFMHDLTMGSFVGDVPNDFGFDVAFQSTIDFGLTSLSGSYDPPHYGACCYGDGTCYDASNYENCATGGGEYFGDNSTCLDNECAPAACGGGGPCGSIHGPGCEDIDCCIAVCELDFACCEFGWDAYCAVLAVEVCGATPGNDDCNSAYSIGLERIPFTTINSTTDGPVLITECATAGPGQTFINDVWFSHVPQVTNGVVVSTCGLAEFNTRLAVYEGCSGQLLACGDDTPGCPGGTSQVYFLGEQGEEYLIRVGGASGWGSGEIDVAWGEAISPPESLAVQWSDDAGGNGHWYAMYSLGYPSTYQMAIDAAAHFGGTIATITSQEEQSFINNSMPATLTGGSTAIGLFQESGSEEPAGGWQWVTGEPLQWTNWGDGEPNDAGGEAFGMMYPDGTWNDGPDVFGHVLLEFTDDPTLDEVVWNIDEGGNGHRYEGVIFSERITWQQAKAYAENQGGHLACFETEHEAEWVFSELGAFSSLWSMTYYNGGPWLGMFKSSDGWWWLSEVPLDWNGWSPGEPNETGDRACWYGSSRFFDNCFDCPFISGDFYGAAQLVDVFGYPRVKLVPDSFPGTWGTWISSEISERVIAFNLSFRFSFKNEDGGPGDGFSVLWGDLSDTSGDRVVGGEWGVNAFLEDEGGLSIGVHPYPAKGTNGVTGRWGNQDFVFDAVDFASLTYSDYQQAGDPNNMATMYVSWSKEAGVSVSIAFPWNDPQVIWADEGADFFEEVDSVNWNLGFAARNGAIDMDVLLGDVNFGYEFVPVGVDIGGGPRNTFDDTPDDNVRRSLIIEYDSVVIECPEDVDGDAMVGFNDVLLVLNQWGPCSPSPCQSDIDGDGTTGFNDILMILNQWGPC